jgi:hypothetical protein
MTHIYIYIYFKTNSTIAKLNANDRKIKVQRICFLDFYLYKVSAGGKEWVRARERIKNGEWERIKNQHKTIYIFMFLNTFSYRPPPQLYTIASSILNILLD